MSLVAYCRGTLIADKAILLTGGMDAFILDKKFFKLKSLAVAVAGGLVDEDMEDIFLGACMVLIERYERTGVLEWTKTALKILDPDVRTSLIMTRKACYVIDGETVKTLRKNGVYAWGSGAPAFMALTTTAGVGFLDAVKHTAIMTPSVSADCDYIHHTLLTKFDLEEKFINEANLHL